MAFQQLGSDREPARAPAAAGVGRGTRHCHASTHRAGRARRGLRRCLRVTRNRGRRGRRPRIGRMSAEPTPESQVPVVQAAPAPAPADAPGAVVVARGLTYALIAIAALSLILSGVLWQKLSNIQEQLARQSREAGSNAIEARTIAKQAQELARETAARQAVLDTRLAEVAL